MPMTPRVWAGRGQAPGPAGLQETVGGSTQPQPGGLTQQAATARCFTKRTLADYLGLSVRSLDRANAVGLLPCPDLVVGRSPRWSPETVHKWLRTHPRLPGRKGGVA